MNKWLITAVTAVSILATPAFAQPVPAPTVPTPWSMILAKYKKCGVEAQCMGMAERASIPWNKAFAIYCVGPKATVALCRTKMTEVVEVIRSILEEPQLVAN